jgi:hypothetical protein
MSLVDNVDLIAPLTRAEADFVAQLAYIIHAIIAGGVDLDQIEHPPFGDGIANGAAVARALGFGRRAIKRLGQDARHRSLACATRPSKEIGVRHSSFAQGVAQGLNHMFLADQLIKVLAAPFAIECLCHWIADFGLRILDFSAPMLRQSV